MEFAVEDSRAVKIREMRKKREVSVAHANTHTHTHMQAHVS